MSQQPASPGLWSEEKLTHLQERLTGCWAEDTILYPSLRVADVLQVKSVRSIPPRPIVPLSVKALNLEVKSDLSALEATKGKSLTKFASQLAIDAL